MIALRLFSLAIIFLFLPSQLRAQSETAFALLGRGINYGNMLEAPSEGEWGLRFDDEFPKLIQQAGFDSVRIPVRWSAHASKKPPYTIDPTFLNRVQHVVQVSLEQDLKVILNVHHFEELYENPDAERERLIAIWRQLAEAFKGADSRVFFEPLNEPHNKLTAEAWNAMLVEVIAEIRKLHPDRWLIIGPDHWSNFNALPNLVLPDSDRRLIVTVHYYLPFPFTHQGAPWMNPPSPTGVKWSGTSQEIEAMAKDFAMVIDWARTHDRPVYVGEFGAFEKADTASRAAWMKQVRTVCEENQFAWGYWELASGFGILDPTTRQWKKELLEALQ